MRKQKARSNFPPELDSPKSISRVFCVETRTGYFTPGVTSKLERSLEERGAKVHKPLMYIADGYSKDLHL
jgi:hypothetical protein